MPGEFVAPVRQEPRTAPPVPRLDDGSPIYAADYVAVSEPAAADGSQVIAHVNLRSVSGATLDACALYTLGGRSLYVALDPLYDAAARANPTPWSRSLAWWRQSEAHRITHERCFRAVLARLRTEGAR